MKQVSFSDFEYSGQKKKTKREEFLEIMDEIIPWDEWVALIEPYYPAGKRGRPPKGIEKMLRMYLLQCWFNLSDEGVEDAIYDSYAMRKFIGINFLEEDAPDATTLLKFRHLLEENDLNKAFFDAINRVISSLKLNRIPYTGFFLGVHHELAPGSRPRGFHIIRLAVNGKAHSLHHSSSSHATRRTGLA